MAFVKTRFSALDGRTKVSFQDDTGASDAFQMVAASDGLHLEGKFTIDSEADLQAFAKLMSDAWTERRKLVKKLATSLSGH